MFLAGKTEDSFVNIVDLLKIYNKATEARVLECEILLLEVSFTVTSVIIVITDCILYIYSGSGVQLKGVSPPELPVLDHRRHQATRAGSGLCCGISGYDW